MGANKLHTNLSEILIVEDDPIVAKIHEFTLKNMLDNQVVVCPNGKEALDRLEWVAEQHDQVLVLLDLNMPVMNGWEFLRACERSHFADKVFVVVVTSSMFREDSNKAAGFRRVVGYYTKPLKKNDILEIINIKELQKRLRS